jgi:hypothetical protein
LVLRFDFACAGEASGKYGNIAYSDDVEKKGKWEKSSGTVKSFETALHGTFSPTITGFSQQSLHQCAYTSKNEKLFR